MNNIASTAIIYPHVRLGTGIVVEDHCIVGQPCTRCEEEHLETVIGNNALIRVGTIIYAGNKIGDDFQTGNKANIRECNVIGNSVSIGTLSTIEHHVTIESGVRIHTGAFIPEHSFLKEGAWLGPHVVLTNAKFPLSRGIKEKLCGPIIEQGAKIGANSTLLPGIIVGKNAIVGAGSVVTKNVAKDSIVAGNPAVFLRYVSQ